MNNLPDELSNNDKTKMGLEAIFAFADQFCEKNNLDKTTENFILIILEILLGK